MAFKKKQLKIKKQTRESVLKLATMTLVVGLVGGGLYYRSLQMRSSAQTPYNVGGYRIYGGSDTPFPAGVGTTTLDSLSTSANPFSYGTSGGNKTIYSSDSITHNGVRYVFDHSRLCYNNDIPRCPGGASISYSQPRTIINPSNYADIWFSYAPARPSVVVQANNYQGSLVVAYNSALTISWGVSDASSCSASGNWSGSKSASGGNENRSGDTASAGSKTYSLTCNGPGGSTTASVSVTVQSPPTNPPPTTTPPPSTTTPPPTTTTPPPSSTTSPGTTRPPASSTSPPLQGGGTNRPRIVAPAAGPDTTAPSKPVNFVAHPDEQGVSINLNWQASVDNSGAVNYRLERSEDQQNWQVLYENRGEIFYADTNAKYGTHYYYRLQAVDGAGNKSDFATTDAKAANFSGNAMPDKDTVLTDEENGIEVTIPAGALSESASCAITSESPENIGAVPKGYIVVGGPFQVLCKKADNSVIASFIKPIVVKWTVKPPKNVSGNPEFYGNDSELFKLADVAYDAKSGVGSFSLDRGTTFTALGQLKKVSVWAKVLGVVVVLLTIVVAVLGFLYWRYRKRQLSAYEDYVHKIRGV